tara:strand:+ start:242 stop:436 length:195 start_codon:yes stop_codon:yes gene_type:complete
MSKKEVKLSVGERLENLTNQLEEVGAKRAELTDNLNTLNQLYLKLQGAIEVLSELDEKEEKKSD